MKTCSKEDCDRQANTKGLCRKHYLQFIANESTDRPKCSDPDCTKNAITKSYCQKHYTRHIREKKRIGPRCSIPDCPNHITSKSLCSKHYDRLRKTGTPTSYTQYDPNEFIDNLDGTHSIVLRTKRGLHAGIAVIDSVNLPEVMRYKWYLLPNGYCGSFSRRFQKYLHQILLTIPEGYVTDHIDRDKLNNRLSNLRIATCSQNTMNAGIRGSNTSGTTGVSYNKKQRKWETYIEINKTKIRLGKFAFKKEAILVRKEAEKKYFKEFAPIT